MNTKLISFDKYLNGDALTEHWKVEMDGEEVWVVRHDQSNENVFLMQPMSEVAAERLIQTLSSL